LEYAERAVALAPNDGLAFSTLGLTLHRVGRWPEAEEAFERGLGLTPDDHRVYYNYACYWAERGNEENCRKYLELACDLAPETFAAVIAGDPDLGRYAAAPWFRDALAALKTRAAE
jgi:Flp pilus assembly protein TadD